MQLKERMTQSLLNKITHSGSPQKTNVWYNLQQAELYFYDIRYHNKLPVIRSPVTES